MRKRIGDSKITDQLEEDKLYFAGRNFRNALRATLLRELG
jgi:hypothetical protein